MKGRNAHGCARTDAKNGEATNDNRLKYEEEKQKTRADGHASFVDPPKLADR